MKSLLLGFCYSFISQITAQKMKFSTKDFFRKCDQILSLLRVWSHLLKKSLMENFIFCAVDHAQSLMIKLAMFWFDADVSFLKSKGKSNSYISQLFELWGTKLCLTTTFWKDSHTFFGGDINCNLLLPWVNVDIYKLGQRIVDKFMKLRKKDFSMECFTANFSLFPNANVKICPLSSRLGLII